MHPVQLVQPSLFTEAQTSGLVILRAASSIPGSCLSLGKRGLQARGGFCFIALLNTDFKLET